MDWEPFLEITQDPNAKLDWLFNFESLGQDSIDSYEIIQTPPSSESELTISDETPDNQTIRLWVTGPGDGKEGENWQVTLRITTARGRINDYSVVYQMRDQ